MTIIPQGPRAPRWRLPGVIRLAETYPRNNNLNLMRALAALAVLVSHAWPIALGREAAQPLMVATGFPLGTQALYVFFAISGFLVTRSWLRRRDPGAWLRARALRLLPGLAVALSLTAFVAGPLLTHLAPRDYIAAPATWAYVPRGLSFLWRQAPLPGVFTDQPYDTETNGSLWSLEYEVMCYAAVLSVGLARGFDSRPRLALVLAAILALKAAVALAPDHLPEEALHLVSLGLPFTIGAALWVGRDHLPLSPLILAALLLALALAWGTGLQRLLYVVTLSYGVILLAHVPSGPLLRYNRLGDYSYGIYIYAWPTQQTAVALFGPMSPITNILLAVPVVLCLAILSWHLVEKPALALARAAPPGLAR
jgi:peptidoglycan/LPS O-acetylase OafA/YrhL